MKSGRERKMGRERRAIVGDTLSLYDMNLWKIYTTPAEPFFKSFSMKQSKHLKRGIERHRFTPRDGTEPRGSQTGDRISVGITATEVAMGNGKP